jgi:methylated-DNA-[protein]-cysteine S-methyltransferase
MPRTTKKRRDFKFRTVETWLGPITYVTHRDRLIRVFLPGDTSYQIEAIHQTFPGCRQENHLLDDFAGQLAEYFAGRPQRFSAPIELSVSDFAMRVLRETMDLDFGQTISYKALAERIGQPKAARAVGNALGANPLPLVIPCHRVISANGALGGFSAGLVQKNKLLAHEKR